MLKRNLFSVCLMMLVLSACGGGGGSSSTPSTGPSAAASQPLSDAQKIAALEASGNLPKLDRETSIRGIDVNANGVRDDIEAVIARKYPQQEQRAAAMQDAAALQSALLTNPEDKAAVKAASLKSSRALKCLFLKFNVVNDPNNASPAIVANETLSLTTNTKARLQAYLLFDKALDGSVISQPQGNTCE